METSAKHAELLNKCPDYFMWKWGCWGQLAGLKDLKSSVVEKEWKMKDRSWKGPDSFLLDKVDIVQKFFILSFPLCFPRGGFLLCMCWMVGRWAAFVVRGGREGFPIAEQSWIIDKKAHKCAGHWEMLPEFCAWGVLHKHLKFWEIIQNNYSESRNVVLSGHLSLVLRTKDKKDLFTFFLPMSLFSKLK